MSEEESIDAFDVWPLIYVGVRSNSFAYFTSLSNASIVLCCSRGLSLVCSTLCCTMEGGVPYSYERISLSVIPLGF